MIVQMVSGSWPPERCGVGDYSALLADALSSQGATIIRSGAAQIPLQTRSARRAAALLRATDPKLIHIQYPTAGYKRSGMPALLPLLLRGTPVIVTLHEFSIFKFYRWPWFASYAYAADMVVFTSSFEQQQFHRRFPRTRARTTVIPIASNIQRGPDVAREPDTLCYFGLIMRGKGVEEFLAAAELLQAGTRKLYLSIIGAVPPGGETYAADVAKAAGRLGISVHRDLPAASVATLLRRTSYAYLPFPDAATERRGSLLATLLNGVKVLAPLGAQTPNWIRSAIVDAPNAAAAVVALQDGTLDTHEVPSLPSLDWPDIAAQHLAIYREVVAAHRPSGAHDAT